MSKVGWIRLAVIVIAVGLLEVCCRTDLINRKVVIPPSEMAGALWRLLVSGPVQRADRANLRRRCWPRS